MQVAVKKVYISNISRVWPVLVQERLIAEHIPEWPNVATYRDELSGAKRQGQSREAMTQRATLLRPASPRAEMIAVASWPVLAWDVRDLTECAAAAKARGASLMALDTGVVLTPEAGIEDVAAVIADFQVKKKSADAGGGRMVGVRASVKARVADKERRVALIKDDWPKPWPSTAELLDRAGRERKIGKRKVWVPMAYSTAWRAIGIRRPEAQAKFQAGLARAEANRKRRKTDAQS